MAVSSSLALFRAAAKMIPTYPTSEHTPAELHQMLKRARQILLGAKIPEAEAWRGYEDALAVVGFKIALELRSRRVAVPLSFFALRIPKGDFELPKWLTEDS